MANPIPKRIHFSRVQEAREALQQKAKEWADAYDASIKAAQKKGEHDIALKAIQWAFEHMPAHDGVTVVDASVDRPKSNDGPTGPTIQIGFQLGGLPTPQALPPPIESTPMELVEHVEYHEDPTQPTLDSNPNPEEDPTP